MSSEASAAVKVGGNLGLVRFNTCGSVDDGKSTLIGRLLFDSKRLFDDQLAALAVDSKKAGCCGKGLDFALLLDGLKAEREQGITIDVAYRFFSTDCRKYIVADTPGHEQYTRNMVTGASTADLSVILVDASKGILPQTRRHSLLVALLGVKHISLVVNKMDLVSYSETTFVRIEQAYRLFAEQLGLSSLTCIPISAIGGDNVVKPSAAMPWYHGPTLVEFLDSVDVGEEQQTGPFRFPVQWVNRPNAEFRGFAGTVASGRIRAGDSVCIQPSGRVSRVKRIVTRNSDLEEAIVGQAVTLTLEDELDVSRGDVISGANSPAQIADQFEVTMVWMSEFAFLRGQSYLMKIGSTTCLSYVMPIKYRISVGTLEHVAATKLELNEIGVCDLQLDRVIAFDPYCVNRNMGGFILIDRVSHDTVGAGMIRCALGRSENAHWQTIEVSRESRARLKGHRPRVLWYTGLSGAGKSTLANLVEKRLNAMGCHTFLLDGDNVRHGLNRDLGFTDPERVENIRRIGEVAKLMAEAGLIVGVAFISPFRSERRMARRLLAPDEFVEIFVDAPLSVAEERDPKGLYKKARRGELKNFTGIDSPYEVPEFPELRIDTVQTAPEVAAEVIVAYLERSGAFSAT